MSRATLLRRIGSAIAIAAAVSALPGASARAQTLEQLLRENVETNDRVVSAQAEAEAARNRAREALGAWFPTLTPTFNFGWEQQNKPSGTADTSTGMRELDFKLSQLLWDFGATNAAVEKARLRLLQAEVSLVGTRQELMLEMAQAYVNLLRAEQVLAYARQSERNIQRQTGLEEARVEAGSGLSTDVLQAKTQLAGAEARRIQAEGSLVSAINRFRAVFGRAPPPASAFDPVTLEDSRLPPDLDTAVRIADDSNVQLLQANLTEAVAREDVDETRSREFFPKVEGIVEQKYKRNVAGTLGSQNETLAKVELSMPINLGGTQFNKLRAAQSTLLARVRTVSDTRRRVEEQVRNAWDQLKTARATAASRRNQANIADAFLELARKERQLGQRSLIDVLSGETNLINAQSDAASAEADVLIAAYSLLRALGRLDYDTFRAMPAVPPGGGGPAGPVPSETTGLSPRPKLPAEMRARLAVDRAAGTGAPPAAPAAKTRALPLRPYAAPEPASLPEPAAETADPLRRHPGAAIAPPPPEIETGPRSGGESKDRGLSSSPGSSAPDRGPDPAAVETGSAGSGNLVDSVARSIENALGSLVAAFTKSSQMEATESPSATAPASPPRRTAADMPGVAANVPAEPTEPPYRPDPDDPLLRVLRALFSVAEKPTLARALEPARPADEPPPSGTSGASPEGPIIRAAANPLPNPSGLEPYRPNPDDPILRFFRFLAGTDTPSRTAAATEADRPAPQPVTESAAPDSDPLVRFFSQMLPAFGQQGSSPQLPPAEGR